MNAKTEVQKSIHIINSVKVTLIRLGFLLPLIKLGGTLHPPLNNSGYIHAIDVKFDIPGQLLTLYKKLILYFFRQGHYFGCYGGCKYFGSHQSPKTYYCPKQPQRLLVFTASEREYRRSNFLTLHLKFLGLGGLNLKFWNFKLYLCLTIRSFLPNGLAYRKTTKILFIKFHEKPVILEFLTAWVQKSKEKQRGYNVPPLVWLGLIDRSLK